MAIEVKKLTNAAVYLDGGALLGQCSEVELPTVTQKMTDHVALGMVGAFQLPAGVEAMEAKFMFNAFYPDAFVKVADPSATVNIQVRASLENYEAGGKTGSEALKVQLRGQFKQMPLGNYKQHEPVELETMMNVHYVKLTIGTRIIFEYDANANIYKVDGVDILAQYRSDIGQS